MFQVATSYMSGTSECCPGYVLQLIFAVCSNTKLHVALYNV